MWGAAGACESHGLTCARSIPAAFRWAGAGGGGTGARGRVMLHGACCSGGGVSAGNPGSFGLHNAPNQEIAM
jgi:hypothetical protein